MSIDWGLKETAESKRNKVLDESLQAWKTERELLVRGIRVEVNGLVYDGDEISQNRMARAVAAADSMDQMVAWTLADNTVATVAVLQLKKALSLASTKQTEIWNEGRPSL